MDLVHCIYCSASAKSTFSRTELDSLLAECREQNAKREVTGMLLYRDGTFFQVLEGDRGVVQELFDKIGPDKRHTRVTKILMESIEERDFAHWTMGYSKVTKKELAEIAGLNDFFAQGHSYLDLNESKAKTLLAAFKEGRWRLSLS